MTTEQDAIIIGAGAAGLMCAITAGRRGRRVRVLDHATKLGEKIRISGGGRCNFTNIHTSPCNFLSANPHFCKSALSRLTPADFLGMVEAHGIAWHEKKLGQLFCDHSAQDIIDMLRAECAAHGVTIEMETKIESIRHEGDAFHLETARGAMICEKLVIATGGLSIPKIGATGFGYDIARQFGHGIVPTRAALVPLTFTDEILDLCRALSGVSVEASVSGGGASFAEGLLFTHRGLSGPSILQISSYWREGAAIAVDLAHGLDIAAMLKARKADHPRQDILTALTEALPRRLAQSILERAGLSGQIANIPDKHLEALARDISAWALTPAGTEGYRTAEVTLGGVDTDGVSSKTMESRLRPGLYFIGEVLDVTGHLGGFNFQWAWASGHAAGSAL